MPQNWHFPALRALPMAFCIISCLPLIAATARSCCLLRSMLALPRSLVLLK